MLGAVRKAQDAVSGIEARPGALLKLVVTPRAETQTDPQARRPWKYKGHHPGQHLIGSSCGPEDGALSFGEPTATTPALVVPPYTVVECGCKGQPGQVRVEQVGGWWAHPVPGHSRGSCQPTHQQEVHQCLQRHRAGGTGRPEAPCTHRMHVPAGRSWGALKGTLYSTPQVTPSSPSLGLRLSFPSVKWEQSPRPDPCHVRDAWHQA